MPEQQQTLDGILTNFKRQVQGENIGWGYENTKQAIKSLILAAIERAKPKSRFNEEIAASRPSPEYWEYCKSQMYTHDDVDSAHDEGLDAYEANIRRELEK